MALAAPASPRQAVYDAHRITAPVRRQIEGFTRQALTQSYAAQIRAEMRALGYPDRRVTVSDPEVLGMLTSESQVIAATIQRAFNERLDAALDQVPAGALPEHYAPAAAAYVDRARQYNREVLIPWTLSQARYAATRDFYGTNTIETRWYLAHPIGPDSCTRCRDLVSEIGEEGVSHTVMASTPMPLHRRCAGQSWVRGDIDESTLPDLESLWTGEGEAIQTKSGYRPLPVIDALHLKAFDPAKHPKGEHGHWASTGGRHKPTREDAQHTFENVRFRQSVDEPLHTGASPALLERERASLIPHESDFRTRFSPEEQQRALDHLHSLGLSVDEIQSNLHRLAQRALPRDVVYAQGYFASVRTWARQQGAAYDLPPERVAAAAAALSPRRPWRVREDSDISDNVRATETLLEYHGHDPLIHVTAEHVAEYRSLSQRPKAGGSQMRRDIAQHGPLTEGSYHVSELSPLKAAYLAKGAGYDIAGQGGWGNVARGLEILRGANIDQTLKGSKVRAFYNSIAAPHIDDGSAIDTHVLRAALDHSQIVAGGALTDARSWERRSESNRFDQLLRLSGGARIPAMYALFNDMMRDLGSRRGMMGHDFQTLTWVLSKYEYLGENPDLGYALERKDAGDEIESKSWDEGKHPRGAHGKFAHSATHTDEVWGTKRKDVLWRHVTPEEMSRLRREGHLEVGKTHEESASAAAAARRAGPVPGEPHFVVAVRRSATAKGIIERRHIIEMHEVLPFHPDDRRGRTTSKAYGFRKLKTDESHLLLHGHGAEVAPPPGTGRMGTTITPVRDIGMEPHQAYVAAMTEEAEHARDEEVATASGGVLSPLDVWVFRQEWVRESSSPRGIALQYAAAEHFGLSVPPRIHDDGKDGQWRKHGDRARAFVRAQYAVTQRHFQEQGITHVDVARGLNFKPDEQPAVYRDLSPGWHDAHTTIFPLSSWSLNPKYAYLYALGSPGKIGYLMHARVPVERVLIAGINGADQAVSSEYVVLGGDAEVAVQRAEWPV